ASFATSTSLAMTVEVDKDSTSTAVTAARVATKPGTYNVNAKVTVIHPGTGYASGFVYFTVDGASPQAVPLGSTGRAHLSVKFVAGTAHTVVVNYQGDARVTGSS